MSEIFYDNETCGIFLTWASFRKGSQLRVPLAGLRQRVATPGQTRMPARAYSSCVRELCGSPPIPSNASDTIHDLVRPLLTTCLCEPP
jgi:hypothetical protein